MEINAEKRKELGKKTRFLRYEGNLPGVIYGKKMESIPVSLDYYSFKKVWDRSGETDLIDIKVDTHSYKVLIKKIQLNPVSGKIDHVEFYKPDLTEKIEVQVPIEVMGEDKNEHIKSGEAMLFYVVDEITVHEFTIDVSQMEVGKSITVKELNYDKDKVEIVDLEIDEHVIRLDKMEEQKEEEVAPVSEEEAIAGMEAIAEKKPEDEEEENKEDKE